MRPEPCPPRSAATTGIHTGPPQWDSPPGYTPPTRIISASAKYFNSLQYNVDMETGLIDYDALEEQAMQFKPKMIIAGFSAYPRDLDYKRFRDICDKVGAYLHADMAHGSGLIAGGEANDPL